MGIQYNTELIIGFELDSDLVEKWMQKHKIDDPYYLNDKLSEIFPEIPQKDKNIFRSRSLSVYIMTCQNAYEGEMEYYLSFYEKGHCTIREINKIDHNLLTIAKKVYKDITDKELECETTSDIPIYSVLSVN